MGEKNQEKNILGTDLKLFETSLGSDLWISRTGDLENISEEMNLAQAILHRLRTIRGELSDTGHSNYGSNIYDYIGEPNNELTRDRLRIVVRTTLLQEPRIKEIVSIAVRVRHHENGEASPLPTATKYSFERLKVSSRAETIRLSDGQQMDDTLDSSRSSQPEPFSDSVDIDITVMPIGSNVPLNIVFPFYLEEMV